MSVFDVQNRFLPTFQAKKKSEKRTLFTNYALLKTHGRDQSTLKTLSKQGMVSKEDTVLSRVVESSISVSVVNLTHTHTIINIKYICDRFKITLQLRARWR